jgi:hypothetical protein
MSTVRQEIEPQNTRMHANEERINALSNRIIGCALKVQQTLGIGFLEKVYETRWRMNCGWPASGSHSSTA